MRNIAMRNNLLTTVPQSTPEFTCEISYDSSILAQITHLANFTLKG
jgi:hypothetical protein